MKKRWNNRRLVPVALLMALVLVCGTVYAYMFHRTGETSTAFAPAQVSCEVAETYNGIEKSSIKVENTGNVDAYLRVRLVTYWVNGEGKVAAKSSPDLGEITLAEGWIAGKDNTFYYKTPVKPGDSTLELLTASITLTEEDGFKQVIDVFAEAIQAEPARAVTESWKVTLTGETITKAP